MCRERTLGMPPASKVTDCLERSTLEQRGEMASESCAEGVFSRQVVAEHLGHAQKAIDKLRRRTPDRIGYHPNPRG